MRTLIYLLFCTTLPPLALAANEWQLRGRVVDEAGKPVANATVDYYWRSNGKQVRPDGSKLDLNREEDGKIFHGNLGQMEPLRGATTATDGSFDLAMTSRQHSIIAMDAERKRGALVIIPSGQESAPVEVNLQPLIKLHGRFRLAESNAKPAWTNVYVEIPEDVTRPIDGLRVTQCSSFEARFETWLPPGKYVLDAYGIADLKVEELDIAVTPNPVIELKGDERQVDLGLLEMKPRPPSPRQKRIAESKADGSWGDFTKHYGQPPPSWHVVDARGVSKSVQLSDFRGKWVLIDFWGLNCASCLGRDLPALMKLYQEHADKRDRFEILAFCIDSDHEVKSLVDVDRLLAPIVKHVWGGKTFPFPVLLDPTFTTPKRYGFAGYGHMLLVDPSGNLVEGDEKTLAEHLKR